MTDINLLPDKPGVYLFKRNNEILYIGKAKNLKNRVKSYFQNNIKDLKTLFLVKKIEKIEWIVTNNEVEALILENNLIKKHKPPYNIKLVDDKTYPYIKIDIFSDFPTVKLTREKINDKSLYFGPFTYALKLKYVLDFIYKNFNIRKCSNKKFQNRIRPCLNYQINICPAPCCNKISKENYKKNIKKVILFLKGKNKKLIDYLKKEMKEFSNNLEFEKAAKVRDLINSINTIFETQLMEFNNFFDKDIIYSKITDEKIFFQVLKSKNGKILESEFFKFNKKDTFYNNILEEFIIQYYSFKSKIPEQIIINKKVNNNLLKKYFLKKFNKMVNIYFPEKKIENLELINLAKENLSENIKRENNSESIFLKMKLKLKLKNIPFRIDAFDIATFHGKSSVGTRVVFVNGKPVKNLYRKYIIKTVNENKLNDFQMIYEIVSRSINECIEDNSYPDLILIDGGKGQLNIAYKVLKENNLSNKLDIISIAKERDNNFDKIYIVNRKNSLDLNKYIDILHLLMKIRDEVHRFSITFHRNKEDKKTFSSLLLQVEGIGEKRALKLLRYFKSVDNIKKADLKQLQNLPFLNKKVAKNLYDFFKHQ